MPSLFPELQSEVSRREAAEQERAKQQADWQAWLNNPVGRQIPLLTGLSCLDGQRDLFTMDGERE